MKKFLGLCLLSVLFLSGLAADAANSIDKAIKSSGLNKSVISVSLRDLKTGKETYHLNANKPLNPASTQKLLTFAASLDTLGADYVFSTELYKSTNNDLYFKLAADPFLTSKDIKNLLATAKSKNIIVDFGVYKQSFTSDGILKNKDGFFLDGKIRHITPKIERELLEESTINKCRLLLNENKLTYDEAMQIINILEKNDEL